MNSKDFFASVSERLRYGVPADQMQSPFEPLARPVYMVLTFESALAAVLLFFGGFRVSPEAILTIPLWALGLCISAMLLRRYGYQRLPEGMEAVGIIYGQGFVALFLIFTLAALSGPFSDDALSRIDRLLGFDWRTFAALIAGRQRIQWLIGTAYNSFAWQPLVILTFLFAKHLRQRAWTFVLAGTLAAFATALIFPFAPAEGTFVHFHVKAALFPHIDPPWQFAPVLRQIKGGERYITSDFVTGLVSFPSYHAAAAATFVWAMWPFRRARWCFLALNVCMCISAMIIGAHYLIDILAGLVLGMATAIIALVATVDRPGAPSLMRRFADSRPVPVEGDF